MGKRTSKKQAGRSGKPTADAYFENPIEYGPHRGTDDDSLAQNRANGSQSDSGIGMLPISVLK
jgi:hypothetical protein